MNTMTASVFRPLRSPYALVLTPFGVTMDNNKHARICSSSSGIEGASLQIQANYTVYVTVVAMGYMRIDIVSLAICSSLLTMEIESQSECQGKIIPQLLTAVQCTNQ